MTNRDPFDILHHLSRAIAQAASLEEIYTLILEEIVAVLGVERASIMRFDPKKEVLKIVAAKGIEKEIWKNLEISIGEGVSGRVWKEGKPLLIKKVKGNPRYHSHSYMIAPVTSFPMRVGETPIGLINVTDKKSEEPFTNSDLKLLTTMADQVASYMHIHDLAGKLQLAEQAHLQLEIARDIQQRLLPKKSPAMRGIEMDGCLISAERVGADYFDYLSNGNQGLGICVADVSGHSVGGALLAFATRSCLRSQMSAHGNVPATLIAEANKVLFGDLLQSEQFISLFYAYLEADQKKIRFTNAGHPPPLIWKAKEKKCEWLLTQDSLLGIDPSLTFHEKECLLEKGDSLVLYTDGLVEAKNTSGERFGAQRLLEALIEGETKSASALLKHLLSSWKTFIDKETPKDDVTLVVLKAT